MEYVIPPQNAPFNLGGSLRRVMEKLRASRARTVAFNRVYAELQSLTEQELIEFGLHRSDLADIARQQVEAA